MTSKDEQKNATPGRRLAKRRKKPRRRHEEFVWYELQVEDWGYYYSFGVDDPKHALGPSPYSQIATLDLKGPLIRPEGHKCTSCVLTSSASPDMMSDRWDEPPPSIGMLSSMGELLNAYVFVPAERMAELVTVAAIGRFRSALITGSRLRYRSGTVHRFHVGTEPEQDEDADEVPN